MACATVVLPCPFLPIKRCTSPRRTVRLTPRKIGLPSADTCKSSRCKRGVACVVDIIVVFVRGTKVHCNSQFTLKELAETHGLWPLPTLLAPSICAAKALPLYHIKVSQPIASFGKRKVRTTESALLPNGKGMVVRTVIYSQCHRKDTACVSR